MKDKGFTLIELLAVIIVLAIILAITVPIVLNIIDKSKSKSEGINKELYLRAVKNAIAAKDLDEEFNPTSCTVNEDGNLTCDGEELVVDVEGLLPCGGTITFENKEVTSETLSYCESDSNNEQDDQPPEIPEPKSFEADTWETIIANVKAGNGDAYKEHIGEEKDVTLNGSGFDNKTYKVRLANTSTPVECEDPTFSQTACGFVIEFVDIISEHAMNSSSTNVGGWPKSEMYKYVNEDIYNALPEDLKEGIIQTKVISGHGSSDSSNFESTDKLYLLSTQEVWENGSSNTINYDTARANTRQLDYYKSKAVTTDSGKYSAAIKNYNGSAYSWWLRAAIFDSTLSFLLVNSNGEWSGVSSGSALGVSPAFRVG